MRDQDANRAILAADINSLRRHAPYVYLIGLGYTEDTLRSEDFGDASEYLNVLDVIDFSTNHWFVRPDFVKEMPCTITAILDGDILPFVHLLDGEEFCMLCSCQRLSLHQISEVMQSAKTTREAIGLLVGQTGCVVSAVDSVRFEVLTRNEHIIGCFK
jgi:hypothetical protein